MTKISNGTYKPSGNDPVGVDFKKANDDFPFDMGPLFSLNAMQNSFDVLKQAIDYLAKNQKKMGGRLANLEDKTAASGKDGLKGSGRDLRGSKGSKLGDKPGGRGASRGAKENLVTE